MALPKIVNNSKDGTMVYEPDIINAAKNGDFEEGIAALKQNPNCITDTEDATGMNAIQVSLSRGQDEFTKFLLTNSSISLMHKDRMGRDALDVAIKFLCSEDVVELVEDKWQEELFRDEKPSNVTALKPKVPKP
jgi:hypothetical protein